MSLHSIKTYFNSEHRLLCLMLITLITSISLGLDAPLSKSLLITHFGVFLLWQPFYNNEVAFSNTSLVVLIAGTVLFITWINPWLIIFWVLLLSSLLNGRIFARGLNRATYGLAVVILFLELTLVLTPNLFNLSGISQHIQTSINIFLLVMTIPLLIVPTTDAESTHVDFIRGFMIVLLTLFLCMGSVIATLTTGQNYLNSLAVTTMIAALFLFSASFLWAPRAGFSGIAQLWEKYLLNIGGPFEQWISRLAILEVNTKIDPDAFLKLSIHDLLERHWVIGVYWKTEFGEKIEGVESTNLVKYEDPKINLALYSNSTIGPALMLHSRLLLSVLTFYYRAKLQERQLINQAHMRAVYETGSKLTHDVKNILQSTQTLTQVIESSNSNDEQSHNLLQKQLPLLTKRLKTTLEKLSMPSNVEAETCSISKWWAQIKSRYENRSMVFYEKINSDLQIVTDVFESVTENLLENARQKRFVEPDIEITVHLHCDSDGFELMISDSGSAMPDAIKASLFKTVITSENGYGIGLYQSGQQAKNAGYNLSLKKNISGDVCFLLSNKNILSSDNP